MKEVKYQVLANVWNEEEQKIKTVIVGEFKEHICALLFQEAYYKHYKANTSLRKLVQEIEYETYLI